MPNQYSFLAYKNLHEIHKNPFLIYFRASIQRLTQIVLDLEPLFQLKQIDIVSETTEPPVRHTIFRDTVKS